MIKKQLYETPDAELLVVKFEEGFLQTSPGNTYTQGGGGTYGDDEIIDNGEY